MPRKSNARARRRLHLQTGNVLPEGYAPTDTFSLAGSNWRRLLLLNGLGVILFFAFGWLFLTAALQVRPEIGTAMLSLSQQSALMLIAGNLAGAAVLIVCHELVHGLFIYLYTRSRPAFGLRLFYAYAAAPGWYFPRGDYTVIALAPFVVLTLLGGAAALWLPAVLTPALLFGLTTNAAGSIGDFAAVAWLMRQPSRALIEDTGDIVQLYHG